METSLGLGLPLPFSLFLYSVVGVSTCLFFLRSRKKKKTAHRPKILIYIGASAIYNLYFHPLRHYPGPKSWAATFFPWSLSILRGHPHLEILELHKCYGDVVRLSPSELSFSHPDAWKEIYGHLKRGEVENAKDPRLEAGGDQSIISASRERHGQLRRLLSHGFSARAMAEQQPLMDKYIDLFIRRLREQGQGGKAPLDSTKWFEWTTFDIIGDLSFGEPFGCLQNVTSHPWVETFFDSLGVVPVQQIICNLPFYSTLKLFYFMLFMPKHIATRRRTSMQFSEETLKKRISLGTDRPDYVDAMLRGEGDMVGISSPNITGYPSDKVLSQKLTDLELRDNATLLTTAGSETTASALTAAIFLLGTHPHVLAKLEAEVRFAFQNDQEINVNSVQNLPYMLAVLKEAMRVHPPVPISIPRVTPPGGAQIAGQHVAEGVSQSSWRMLSFSCLFRALNCT